MTSVRGGHVPAQNLKATRERVLAACRESADGQTTQTDLQAKLPDVPLQILALAINGLLQLCKIQMYKVKESSGALKIAYKALSQDETARWKNLSVEELLVYQLIRDSGNQGIWTRDLKLKSGLQQPQVAKFLKGLENRKLIKSIKSVKNKNRKVYMIFELEPSATVTGGAWYTDNELDNEYIDVLRDACLQFVRKRRRATVAEISQFIREKKLSKVELGEEEFVSIVKTLTYDGKLDEYTNENGDHEYIPAFINSPVYTPMLEVPCGSCPVFRECKPGGVVNPTDCIYLTQYFDGENVEYEEVKDEEIKAEAVKQESEGKAKKPRVKVEPVDLSF